MGKIDEEMLDNLSKPTRSAGHAVLVGARSERLLRGGVRGREARLQEEPHGDE